MSFELSKHVFFFHYPIIPIFHSSLNLTLATYDFMTTSNLSPLSLVLFPLYSSTAAPMNTEIVMRKSYGVNPKLVTCNKVFPSFHYSTVPLFPLFPYTLSPTPFFSVFLSQKRIGAIITRATIKKGIPPRLWRSLDRIAGST